MFQVKPRCKKKPFPLLINLNLFDAVVAIFYFDFKQRILFIVCSQNVQEVNIPVKESVCSDDHRLAIIKSQLIAKNTGQILNPFSSKGNGNIASDAKVRKFTTFHQFKPFGFFYFDNKVFISLFFHINCAGREYKYQRKFMLRRL